MKDIIRFLEEGEVLECSLCGKELKEKKTLVNEFVEEENLFQFFCMPCLAETGNLDLVWTNIQDEKS